MGSTPSNLSASRGAAILGLSKYKSPLVAWLEIMEERQPGFCFKNGYEIPLRSDPWATPLNPKHASLRWGLAFEDAICDIDGSVINREKEYSHPDYPWMTCHVDGEKDGRNVENKTAFIMAYEKGWGETGSNMIPKEYMVQIQHQMLLTGQQFTDVNVLVFPKAPAEWEKMGYRVKENGKMIYLPNKESKYLFHFASQLKMLGYFHKYHVEADPELQKEILDRYVTFWNENVLKEVEPPIQGYDDIKWLIASPEGEIEATEEMKGLWSEKCDNENEVKSLLDRNIEIKDNFAKLIQIEIATKNVKPGNEDRKLNIYAGARKLGSITKSYPGLKVSKKMVDTAKEDDPELYEMLKKTTFLDIMKDEIELTDKQREKFIAIDEMFERIAAKLDNNEDLSADDTKDLKEAKKLQSKFLKSLKLSKLLTKDSFMKALQKNKPEAFNFFHEHGLVEETTPKSSLRLTKNSED